MLKPLIIAIRAILNIALTLISTSNDRAALILIAFMLLSSHRSLSGSWLSTFCQGLGPGPTMQRLDVSPPDSFVPLSSPGASIITWNFLRKRQLPTMTSSNPVPRILGLSGQWVGVRRDRGKTMPFSRKTGSSKTFECHYFRFSGFDWTSLKSTSFPLIVFL